MKMPPAPPNKTAKAKVKKTDWPTKWERRLGRDGKEDMIKPQVEDEEEKDDEATEDDDFSSYQGNLKNAFASTRQPKGGPVF
ncbi:hypothetical protein PVK06_039390 [Gossypium arboreum]|uniref:Uncharacterized protein n=1 Tax=Gossypium arboreum TaxID=29729 RepID=A0ABR0N2Z8_GOSAR|nr:hypothetical protein PVK06_039390 [Gossypium arboreum]